MALTHVPSHILLVAVTLGESQGEHGFMTMLKRTQSLREALEVTRHSVQGMPRHSNPTKSLH